MLARFIACTSGAVAAIFGFMLPVMIGGAGMAVDVSKAYLVKNRMCMALDAATLAAGSSTGDAADLKLIMDAFVKANYPDDDFRGSLDTDLDIKGSLIKTSAETDVYASFMGFLGKEKMTVYCATQVKREVRGLEVALVVDVTGSMASNNNIEALKTASRNFVNILYDRTTDENNVKIGIVPYVATVNVGPYGLGLDEFGNPYDDAFVNNPLSLSFDQSSFSQWHGCILARDYPEDTQDGIDPTWRWNMYRHDFSRASSSTYRNNAAAYNNYYGPNYACNRNYVQPLISNRQQLQDKIDLFYPDGWTHGNTGMVWGYRLISPEFPFEEGAAWEDEEWQKAVLMMTDGINTVPTTYGAYDGYLDYVAEGINTDELNDRFEETCNAMKAKGVIIYTVTFTSAVNASTRDYYRRCATDPEKYINAPEQADLIEAFERISTELSNLHITK